MNCTREACAECRKRCLLFHGKGKDSIALFSFFKIMFGDRFSNALFFPPTVAPILLPLVNKEVTLEDRNGRQWIARVSYTEDSYALQEGWNRFISEHGAELGDFLVFHYVGEAHFLVELYGRRTARQILDFSDYSNKSRSQNGIPVAAKDEPGTKKARASADKVGSSTSTGADGGNVGGYGRSRRAEGSSLPPGRIIGKSLNVPELPSSMVDCQFKGKQTVKLESAASTENSGTKESLGVAKLKSTFTRKDNTKGSVHGQFKGQQAVKLESTTSTEKTGTKASSGVAKLRSSFTVLADRQYRGNSGLALGAHSGAGSDGKGLIRKQPGCSINLGPKRTRMEESPLVLSLIARPDKKVPAGMKHELVIVEDSPSPAKARFTCSITAQQPFLELPELLSGICKKRRGRVMENVMLVLLRDPEMRLWPVLYHEEKKYEVKLFASGWEAFSEANNIRTGDECVFGVECEADATFDVRIVRKLLSE